jgi:putative transposase
LIPAASNARAAAIGATARQHDGTKVATSKILKPTRQRCRASFMCNAMAHAGKAQRRTVSAASGTAPVQESADAARAQLRSVAD